MSTWGDGELLVQLIDRQFSSLGELRGTGKVLRIPRLLSFLSGEPQVAGILTDLKAEADLALQQFAEADRAIREGLASIWTLHGAEIRSRLEGLDAKPQSYWPIDKFGEGLAEPIEPWFPVEERTPADRTGRLLLALRHWWQSCAQKADAKGEPLPEPLQEVGEIVGRLVATHDYTARRLREAARSLPWPAFDRLVGRASMTNPAPPSLSDVSGWEMHYVTSQRAKELRDADAYLDTRVDTGVTRVDALYDSIDEDARILHEELRLRIGQGRSRLALVRRYVARCEAFDAKKLRDACNDDPGNADRLLTLDLARFLFDAGLPTVIDGTIGGLRPDLVNLLPTSLFYVEAKQYGGPHPKSQLKKAYSQVWGTWGRLRKLHPSDEGFLVVFRRDGPWLELPPVLHHEGQRLYSVVADISTDAGSREKHPVIALMTQDLLPGDLEEEIVELPTQDVTRRPRPAKQAVAKKATPRKASPRRAGEAKRATKRSR